MNYLKQFILLFYLMSFCTTSLEIQHKELDIKLRELSAELRCMVCQNQSLLDSDSDLANDLKKLIYQKLKEGKSKDEIKSFLVDRYGEFILFKPLFSYTNLILWMAPFISILIIGFIGFRKIKQQK